MWLAKAWTAIDRLLVIWKSDLSDKNKMWNFQAVVMSVQLCGQWLSVWRKSLMPITQECFELYWTHPGSNIPQNNSCIATYHTSRKPPKLDEPDMQDTAGEVRMNSLAMYSSGTLNLDDQLEPIFNNSVLIQDEAWKTYRERWTIETSSERESGKSVLMVTHHDDDDAWGFL